MDLNNLEPEKNDGNIEYKLKLVETNELRIEELATQMRCRTEQGNGECIYILGVKDNGQKDGLSDNEFNETIKNLNIVASKNQYNVSILTKHPVQNSKHVYEILIRRKRDTYKEIKVIVVGNVDSSKSSTIGVLTTGKNDDGNGSARSNVFNYIHELKSGRTSSIAQHILGFTLSGKIENYNNNDSWEDIVQKSTKIVSFYDLCGHEAYLKTTILGIAATYPDFSFVCISANNGISRITKEHIFLCVTLKIPFVILLTKVDICKDRQNVLEETIFSINKLIKFPTLRRLPFTIKNMDDVLTAAKNIYSESIVPIFHTSNVTGEGLDFVRHFLNIVSNRIPSNFSLEPVEFYIDNVFNVYGFGLVVGGQLVKGTLKVGDKLYLGPIENKYQLITVKSIYCKKISVQEISCGGYVCIGIKKKIQVKRGNVLVNDPQDQILVKKFKAKINVLKSNSTTVKFGYEPILHTASIRETVKILAIENKYNSGIKVVIDDSDSNHILRSGDSATVTFEFKYNYHYLKPNTNIILCEGITKIVGIVSQVYNINDKH
jgi:GTPase